MKSDVSCEAFDRIEYDSKADSHDTVVQIKEHNAAFCCTCFDKYPKECKALLEQLSKKDPAVKECLPN